MNVIWIAGQCRPTERTFSFAEQRTNEERYEAADFERILHSRFVARLSAKVVAVVESDGAAAPIPPNPAVTTSFPRSESLKRVFATDAKHSYVPCRIPWVPM